MTLDMKVFNEKNLTPKVLAGYLLANSIMDGSMTALPRSRKSSLAKYMNYMTPNGACALITLAILWHEYR